MERTIFPLLLHTMDAATLPMHITYLLKPAIAVIVKEVRGEMFLAIPAK